LPAATLLLTFVPVRLVRRSPTPPPPSSSELSPTRWSPRPTGATSVAP